MSAQKNFFPYCALLPANRAPSHISKPHTNLQAPEVPINNYLKCLSKSPVLLTFNFQAVPVYSPFPAITTSTLYNRQGFLCFFGSLFCPPPITIRVFYTMTTLDSPNAYDYSLSTSREIATRQLHIYNNSSSCPWSSLVLWCHFTLPPVLTAQAPPAGTSSSESWNQTFKTHLLLSLVILPFERTYIIFAFLCLAY